MDVPYDILSFALHDYTKGSWAKMTNNEWDETHTIRKCLSIVLRILKHYIVQELENTTVNYTLKNKAGDKQTMWPTELATHQKADVVAVMV